MNPGAIALFGVSMVIVIPLLVQGFKALGLPDSVAPWVALGLSGLAAGASELLTLFPDVNGPVYVSIYIVVSGLLLWLMVTGSYHTGKNLGIMPGPIGTPAPPSV